MRLTELQATPVQPETVVGQQQVQRLLMENVTILVLINAIRVYPYRKIFPARNIRGIVKAITIEHLLPAAITQETPQQT